MEQQFYKWLIRRGYSETGAAKGYSRAINLVSKHYSEQTGSHFDVYSITDQNIISQIAYDCSKSGKYSEFGDLQHGRFRAATARYSEFFVLGNEVSSPNQSDEIVQDVSNNDDSQDENELNLPQSNFAYERDLQTTVCAQISELFPGYKIWGESSQGVEYSVGKRRIDVLLEHIESGDLLVVELKSGFADFKVFGQISMYVGLIQKQFLNKTISGVIIAGSIDESLRQACEITDKIALKVYRMSVELEDV